MGQNHISYNDVAKCHQFLKNKANILKSETLYLFNALLKRIIKNQQNPLKTHEGLGKIMISFWEKNYWDN